MTADLRIERLTPDLMDAMGAVLRGGWGRSCWCMHPRLGEKAIAALPGSGPLTARRRAAMTSLAARPRAPGLLAFDGDAPVGWIAIGPRGDFGRVDASRATPRWDDVDVWLIPCVTVAKIARGQGVAVALIEAAVRHAFEAGAPAVEAYPRAGAARTGDDNAYFGAEPMFARAGFRVLRGPLPNAPRNWTPRVVMRITPEAT